MAADEDDRRAEEVVAARAAPGEDGAPAPLTGSRPSDGCAVLAWRIGGVAGQLVLDPRRAGPLLAPVAVQGANLAAALVDALDQFAALGGVRAEGRRGEATVTLVRSAEWPAPTRPPSEVLAGQPSFDGLGFGAAARDPEAQALEQVRSAFGEAGLTAIREFPPRRRALIDETRRAERRFWSLDGLLRRRRRKAAAFVGACVMGFGVALAGVLWASGAAAASGGMLFALGAAGVVVEAFGCAVLGRRRGVLRGQIADSTRRAEDLEQDLRRLARRVGAEDPWRLAERLTAIEAAAALPAEAGDDRRRRQEVVARVARLVGLDPAAIDEASRRTAGSSSDAKSWPLDVAATASAEAAAGMVRLLHRVERDLPVPWPVVVWEPWPGAASEERARSLMALSRAAPGRTVVAVVSA